MRPHSFARPRPLKPRSVQQGTHHVLRLAMAWLRRDGRGRPWYGLRAVRATAGRGALGPRTVI